MTIRFSQSQEPSFSPEGNDRCPTSENSDSEDTAFFVIPAPTKRGLSKPTAPRTSDYPT